MGIVATTLPTFPNCPSYGFSSRPEYLVKKIMREGGFERRNRSWAHPLHHYDGAPMGPRFQDDIETLLAFWHAMGGEFQAFRFLDLVDYRSCGLSGTITPLDQPIGFGSGSPAPYQLIKRYAVSGFEQLRPIFRPAGSSIRIANELGIEQPTSAWSINEDTGIVIPNGSFAGAPATWGGEFYVKCRFEAPFAPEIVDQKIHNLTCNICEIREE